MILKEYFEKLRFDPNHHLGMGDIRLTFDQQKEIEKKDEYALQLLNETNIATKKLIEINQRLKLAIKVLRDLRFGTFIDVNEVNGLIEETLKHIEQT